MKFQLVNPPIVEAIKFDGKNGAELCTLCESGKCVQYFPSGDIIFEVYLPTALSVRVGDYVVRDSAGKIYVSEPLSFEKDYKATT